MLALFTSEQELSIADVFFSCWSKTPDLKRLVALIAFPNGLWCHQVLQTLMLTMPMCGNEPTLWDWEQIAPSKIWVNHILTNTPESTDGEMPVYLASWSAGARSVAPDLKRLFCDLWRLIWNAWSETPDLKSLIWNAWSEKPDLKRLIWNACSVSVICGADIEIWFKKFDLEAWFRNFGN